MLLELKSGRSSADTNGMTTAYGQAGSTPVAGWYPDPHAPGAHRWWDGTQWTEHTQQEPATTGTSVAYPQQAATVPGYPAPASDTGFGSVPGYPAATASYPAATASYPTATYPSAPPSYPGTWSASGAFTMDKPKNRTATWALVAGIVVVLVLVFTDYAVASWLAVVVGVQGIKKARTIRAEGYPKAVGMARAVTGLVLSGIGVLLFFLSLAVQ